MTVSLFREQNEYQDRLTELATMGAVDLTNLQDELEGKQKQLTTLQSDIEATEQIIVDKINELAALNSDSTLTNIESRVTAILTAEKTIELLRGRLSVLKNLSLPINADISKLNADIAELSNHLKCEALTADLELFISKEFLPSQSAHAALIKKLFERLNSGHHYLKVGSEKLTKPGELRQLLNDDGRKFKYELVRYHIE